MAAEGGRERLFEAVVAENRRRIVAIARSFAHGDEYQDLCQEILLRLWEGLDGFEGRSARSTWIYRIALNTAITFRRKNSRRAETAAMPLPECLLERIAAPEPGNELLILQEFLGSLGKIDRAVFLLYLEDASYREMSEFTGMSEDHVGVRINRLKRAFVRRYCGGVEWKSTDSNRPGSSSPSTRRSTRPRAGSRVPSPICA